MPPCRTSLPHLLATPPCHILSYLLATPCHTSLPHLATPLCHTLSCLLATPCHTSLPHFATPPCYTSLSHLLVTPCHTSLPHLFATPPCHTSLSHPLCLCASGLFIINFLEINTHSRPVLQFFTKCCMSIFVDITDNDIRIQWNLAIEDTIGTKLAVLYREMSPIQR